MTPKETISTMKSQLRDVLVNNILKFWIDNMQDLERGGYYGRMDGSGTIHKDAERGAILNARILWTFSAAYRVIGDPLYLRMAQRTKQYIYDHFIDKQYGGVYWSVDCNGQPLDTKKQSYAIGFTIYGLSEFLRATAPNAAGQHPEGVSEAEYDEAARQVMKLFHDVEQHAYDSQNNGYVEALSRDWQPIADMRLSDKDENGSRTMNTHLHILEPYTNLLRALPHEMDADRVRNLIGIFIDKFMNKDLGHLDLFFNDTWEGKRDMQSYGHDIEASWLMHEALHVLEEEGYSITPAYKARVETAVKTIARASEKGLRADGAMIYETNYVHDHTDASIQWWVQCENIIGQSNLYQFFGDETALNRAWQCWQYTRDNIVDREGGEWFWSINPDGTTNHIDDKAGFWKCPYHNARLCLEIIEREF